jgi:hypothetical protein
VGEVIGKGQADDAVSINGRLLQNLDVRDVAAQRLTPELADGRGRRLGSGQPDDLMTGSNEFRRDGSADPATGTGEENAHRTTPSK